MLLIISDPRDDSVRMVVRRLAERDVPFLWWDEADFPERTLIGTRLSGEGWRQSLTHGGTTYDLAEVTAVWHRRPNPPSAPSVADQSQRAYAEQMARQMLHGVYELMPAERWMPARPKDLARVDNKLLHLRRAVELGFTVPDTVIGNDPGDLVPAWRRSGGRLISKALDFRPFFIDGEVHHVYTTKIERRDLAGRHRVRHCPVILQPNLAKAVELRVTVVGDRVFSAEIDSQSSRLTSQDWRHYEDLGVAYRPHPLPAEVEKRCLRLVGSLGLSYGAVDLILTPDGEYVFLELNVSGQWAFVELRAGLPIGDAIAGWLTEGRS
ncbi:MvdC/MvdD family ATP grasp protein [Microbispora sp. ATCC PTA-5024]|uniref:MvdC/MvdD family ATP grasp protein n=1 Tax=Microbispora sp. ATCC PTA-5024 TaxID=316330 RepID=UPI0003DC78D1|nr:hypothetical protein [Microbispora sp. ATCC PTA-5024]ETK30649.1 hypothetical protein MPTA5024_39230 [Microbispora sp. ATCC PTA-5024]